MNPLDSSRFISPLESVRGIGALIVAYAHCSIVLQPAPTHVFVGYEQLLADWIITPIHYLVSGRSALIVFFVMSGLVLSLMVDRMAPGRPLLGYAGYFARRVLRIYPAHVAALILFVPFAWLLFRLPVADRAAFEASASGANPWLNGAVYGTFDMANFLQTAVLGDNYYNAITWSLRVEIIASAVLPVFALLSRPGRLALDLPALALLVAGSTLLADARAHPDSFLLFLPAFYLGCMVRTHGRRLAELAARGSWRVPAALAISYALLVAPDIFVPDANLDVRTTLTMSGASFVLVSLIAWAESRVRTILQHRLLRWFGRISYSFYLWHWLIICAATRGLLVLLTPAQIGGWQITLFFAAALTTIPLALFVAALSYRWIERPFLAVGRDGWRPLPLGRRGPPPPPTAAEIATAP